MVQASKKITEKRLNWYGHVSIIKGALYRIWCGVNRLGDNGVKVV